MMRRNRESGQALIFVGFSLVVLAAVVGLAIDMGYLRYTKRRLQTAADSAAIAGASELNNGNFRAAALNDSKSNGFEDGVNGVIVTPHHPPVDPPFSTKPDARTFVEVQVQQNAPTFFMRIFGINHAAVSATAVAQLGSSRGCIYALGLLNGITVQGNVNAPNCAVIDNAILSVGGGCITASSIGVVLRLLGACTNPPPVVGIDPSPDPLAYLVPPAPGPCMFTTTDVVKSAATTTLHPGTYCGGIQIANGNSGTVIFTSGLYILDAIGLQIQAGNTGNVSGNGVTFFITGGGSAQISGTGNVTLTAPTTAPSPGIAPGVLFFQDRGDPAPASINGNIDFTGALYFPNATLTLGGTVNSGYAVIVGDVIQFKGNVNVGSDFSSLPGGSPVKAAVLVQ
jgi:Putative Flp pilus-assembly TadE/G-like